MICSHWLADLFVRHLPNWSDLQHWRYNKGHLYLQCQSPSIILLPIQNSFCNSDMSICFLKDLRTNLEEQSIQQGQMERKSKLFFYSLQTITGECMAGFTFFCSTLRNVSHFKSSRISCGRQHLLLIRREATRSQHSSSSQIFPLTCKFYHALPL